MPNIELPAKRFHPRSQQIRELLKHLVKSSGGPACRQVPRRNEIVLGTYDGAFPKGASYRDWRFHTYVPRVQARYFERWIATDVERQTWILLQAYLSLFRIESNREEIEVLALHCDPNEPDGNSRAEYKRGPHLHIVAAEEPIPRSHIALNNGFLDEVLQSAASLSNALDLAIQMLRDEILNPIAGQY